MQNIRAFIVIDENITVWEVTMNRIDVISYLVEEIKSEQRLLQEYNDAMALAEVAAEKKSIETGNYVSFYRYLMWDNKTIPHKSLIQQNLRKIRQLALMEYKEVK